MKSFKLVTIVLLGITSLYASALSLTAATSSGTVSGLYSVASALTSSVNAVSLPASVPFSASLGLKKSSLPSIILSVPFPLNSLSASLL